VAVHPNKQTNRECVLLLVGVKQNKTWAAWDGAAADCIGKGAHDAVITSQGSGPGSMLQIH